MVRTITPLSLHPSPIRQTGVQRLQSANDEYRLSWESTEAMFVFGYFVGSADEGQGESSAYPAGDYQAGITQGNVSPAWASNLIRAQPTAPFPYVLLVAVATFPAEMTSPLKLEST